MTDTEHNKRDEHGWLDEDKASVRATQNTHTHEQQYIRVHSEQNDDEDNVTSNTNTQKTAPAIVDYGA